MPSQLQHELNKIRGTVSSTGKKFTSSIASLSELINTIKENISCLDSEQNNLKIIINKALKIAKKAQNLGINALPLSGGCLSGNLGLNHQNLREIRSIGRKTDNMNSNDIYFHSGINPYMDFYIEPILGNADINYRFNRWTNTTGSNNLLLYKGDGSTTITFSVNLATGDIENIGEIQGADLHTCKITNDIKGTPEEGDLYMDIIGHRLKFYNGTTWKTLSIDP